ncbi:ABC transporter permease [Frankia sp. CNm7]|uniref:ABC transporter permease n=1 Tax=Frankia nepalensis TaxID=1836974 RepID=A0A937UT39_9ACTN|nr:ABC transporter permease [Frankia nepalensis]MBL7498513.1 ABC transporter permease [Frankia nepalensis]MBL7514626.1 ABC transporter permease [Frankia nepalensis]MBL7524873.1 ABC transporter permease [Frankia nepalensis]MBL7630870.1 ABC transporter permease [Frankia nepalensis]
MTTQAAPEALPRGDALAARRTRTARVLGAMTRSEARLLWREPVIVMFAVGLPVVLVAILGSVPAFRDVDPELGGVRVIDLYLPITSVMAVAMLGLNLTTVTLGGYREKGILKRLATTPVSPLLLLAAHGLVVAGTAVLVAVLAHLVGAVAFDVPVPEQPVGYALAFSLTIATLVALGLLIAAVAPSAGAANGIGTGLFFPLMFFAGLWAPREAMPDVLVRISDATPLGAAVGALQDSMAGSWPGAVHVGVMAAYIVLCGAGAARWFRWT